MQKAFWIFVGLLAMSQAASIFADDDPTTAAPGATTAAPGVTTEAPGATTAAPGVTTEAPGVTTAAPGATTAAPGVTTEAPGTTKAPETTAAPGGTTATPSGTTATPSGTTATPAGTTATPAGTTPGGTTATPSGTTATPGGTTATPAGTTATPAGTTAGGTTATPSGTTATPSGTTATPSGTTATPSGTTTAPEPCVYPTRTWGTANLNEFMFCLDGVATSQTCILNHYYVSNSKVSGCVPAAEMDPQCIDTTIKPPVCTGDNLRQMQRSNTLTSYYLCTAENAAPDLVPCLAGKVFANNNGYLGCFDWPQWRIASGCNTYALPQ